VPVAKSLAGLVALLEMVSRYVIVRGVASAPVVGVLTVIPPALPRSVRATAAGPVLSCVWKPVESPMSTSKTTLGVPGESLAGSTIEIVGGAAPPVIETGLVANIAA